MSHTLVITNDFPPRRGGIQTYVWELVRRFPSTDITVLTSRAPGWAEFDALQEIEIIRVPSSVLLPTPRNLRLIREIISRTGSTRVLYGAAAPLGLLAPALRRSGISVQVAMSMGHEVGWAMTPILRSLLWRIGANMHAVTYLAEYTRNRIGRAFSSSVRSAMVHLPPGVDVEVFHPRNKQEGAKLRAEVGFADRPVVVCVSRLFPRKGQDTLLRVLPQLAKRVPNVALLLVGEGRYRKRLERIVANLQLQDSVHFTGEVPYADLPNWYAAGDVFAMPCRTRRFGWDVEGLGIVYLEASATGLPVVAGNSGGAPEAVLVGQTGYVSNSSQDVLDQLTLLLQDSKLREQFGLAGRDWVEREWTWQRSYERLAGLLA